MSIEHLKFKYFNMECSAMPNTVYFFGIAFPIMRERIPLYNNFNLALINPEKSNIKTD
jgi:hypothetical protein